MFKVLLVDDEVIIRNGLKKIINWNSIGFEIAGEATNGEDALKKIESLKPDVVITDIRMASSDGIYLLKEMKKRNETCEIIVLSGYDDFSYIQEAMSANAYSYLLKPVNIEKLYKIMNELKDKILSKQKTKSTVDAYNVLMEEKIILKLINGLDYKEICEKYPQYKFPEENFITAIVSVDNKEHLNTNKAKAFLSLTEVIDHNVSQSTNHIIKCLIEQGKYALVILIKDDYFYDQAIKMLNNILSDFNRNTNLTLTIGISGIFRKPKQLPRSYEQCIKALSQKAVMGNNRIIDYIQYTSTKNEPVISANDLIEAIRSEKFILAHKIIDDYFNDVIKHLNIPLSSVKNTIAELAIMIIKTILPDKDAMMLIFGRSVKPISELEKMELIIDIQNWINDIILSVENHSKVFLITTDNELVKKAIDIIHKNYDSHITLNTVSDSLFVSARHLTRCFKQEIGMTFNDYLTMYRMRKAHLLIETGKYKISETAALVGYNDPKYFSKLYKNFKENQKNQGWYL